MLPLEITLRPSDIRRQDYPDRESLRTVLMAELMDRVGTVRQHIMDLGGEFLAFNLMSQVLMATLAAVAVPRLADHELISQIRLPEPLSADDRQLEQLLAPGCHAEDLREALRLLRDNKA